MWLVSADAHGGGGTHDESLRESAWEANECPEVKEEMDRFCETEMCSMGAIKEFRDMLEVFQAR